VRTLDGFHVKVEGAGFGVWADGGIAGVGEGAGLAVAEAGDVVLVAAEVLLFGGSEGRGLVGCGRELWVGGMYLSLKEQNCWLITCHTISSEAMVKEWSGRSRWSLLRMK